MGLGFGVEGLGFRVCGLGFGVWDLEFTNTQALNFFGFLPFSSNLKV